MSAAVLLLIAPRPAPATESDHSDWLTVNGIAIGTSYWPQPPGHEDRAWTAWYAEDEPDDLGGMNFGHGSSRDRAVANLFFLFPREN